MMIRIGQIKPNKARDKEAGKPYLHSTRRRHLASKFPDREIILAKPDNSKRNHINCIFIKDMSKG